MDFPILNSFRSTFNAAMVAMEGPAIDVNALNALKAGALISNNWNANGAYLLAEANASLVAAAAIKNDLISVAQIPANTNLYSDGSCLIHDSVASWNALVAKQNAWLDTSQFRRTQLEEFFRACQIDVPRQPWPSCYPEDYLSLVSVDLSHYLEGEHALIDARPEETRPEKGTHPHDEKRLPQFAEYFIKLKQLLLDLIQSAMHSKRRFHTGEKIDPNSLLQQLRNRKTHDRSENSARQQTGNAGLSPNFHVGDNDSFTPWSLRRIQACEENKRVTGTARAEPAIGAASPAF